MYLPQQPATLKEELMSANQPNKSDCERVGKTLPTTESILAYAARVIGGPADVEAWLHTPALALGWQKPGDLLTTSPQEIFDLLVRMEYCVYI